MAYETIVGIQVTDNKMYAKYREEMTPILLEYGGGFKYDFVVSNVLQNDKGQPINRVFIIYFENKQNKDSFFSNEEYQKVKQKYFVNSVDAVTIISEYVRDL